MATPSAEWRWRLGDEVAVYDQVARTSATPPLWRNLRGGLLRDALHDLEKFVEAIAAAAGVLHEFGSASDHVAALGCARHGDTPAAPKLEQSLVAKDAQRS